MEKSRQIGMSWTSAYRLVRNHSFSSSARDSWVSSRDELQAKLFIEDCKKFADIINTASTAVYGKNVLSGADCSSLEFSNGSRIWSLSSNPDAQAGKRGARILDEFALHPDPEKLYAISLPGITWGGNIEIISTHRGQENFFNRLIEEVRFGGNPKNISLHSITLQDALEQGLLQKIKASAAEGSELLRMNEAQYFDYIKNSCADESMFMQEYMCRPTSEDDRFLPFELIRRCLYADEYKSSWQKISSKVNPLYLGVDVGRTSDLSVFWLLEHSGDVLYTRDVKALKNMPFAEQEIVLNCYLENPSVRRVCIDNTGLGRQFAERALSRYGSARIEPVVFTQASKELMAYPLKHRFEQATVRIPNETEILSDLHKIRKGYSLNGLPKFSADRDNSGHSDRFWALALANYACKHSAKSSTIEKIPESKYGFVW